jgi:peptidyl-tRNA hydrolase
MKLKIIYRKNLEMTPMKLAAQCVHAATGIGHTDYSMNVVVLRSSNKKFKEKIEELQFNNQKYFIVKDLGHTELSPGTETCLAYYE